MAVRWAKRELGIDPGIEGEDEAMVWQEFDYVAELLADGGPYLCATASAPPTSPSPRCRPDDRAADYGVALPQPDVLAPETAALVRRFREHPAGVYAMGLFETRRRATA